MSRFFRIVVPNYNNKIWLPKCIDSVKNQTFKDYGMVIVDDCSNDGSMEEIVSLTENCSNILPIYAPKKLYNGGSRNEGMKYFEDTEYTLFLDSDDWLASDSVLQDLHDFIIDTGLPDCIRLPYKFEYDGNKTGQVMLNDDTPEKLVRSCFVACWTKCIKTSLMQQFPENTLMEDVVQHIKQCDVIEEVVPFNKLVVVHNKNNLNSCTKKENLDAQNGKFKSSMFRYVADLMELRLDHDYCKKVQTDRINGGIKNIKNGVYSQSI